MKSILAGLLLAGCCLPVGVGAAQIVSAFDASQKKHEFANLDLPLWSNPPTKVDREHQNYERLPALLVANANITHGAHRVLVVAPNETSISSEAQQAEISSEHSRISWCHQRYSSYRADDNSYQPFGGCEVPVSPGKLVSQASLQQQPQSENSARFKWCTSHYASYQPRDNSYRAFSGARRQCASPFAAKGENARQASM